MLQQYDEVVRQGFRCWRRELGSLKAGLGGLLEGWSDGPKEVVERELSREKWGMVWAEE
jgi:hypothetical protein